MNLLLIAVFSACTCFVNGQHRTSKRLKAIDTEDTNYSGVSVVNEENSIDEQKVVSAEEHYLRDNENSTFTMDEVRLLDKYMKYWPQIVIIKPMGGYLPPPNVMGKLFGKRRPGPIKKVKVYNPLGPGPVNTGLPHIFTHNTHYHEINTGLPNVFTPHSPHHHQINNGRPHIFTTYSTYPPENPMSSITPNLPQPMPRETEYVSELTEHETTNSDNTELNSAETEDDIADENDNSRVDDSDPNNADTQHEATDVENMYTEADTYNTEHSNEPPELENNNAAEDTNTETSCPTPDGGTGECVSVVECPVLLELVNKKNRTSQELDRLKKSQCGYKGSSPAVCCPKETPTPEANCYTPEGTPGQCISLYSCSHLANMLKPPVPSENIAYVQKSRCEGTEQYSVCCGPPPNRNPTVIPPSSCEARMSSYPPDPHSECCGVDSRVGNKIVGGNATTVDQYPWLVMIEYVKLGVTKLLCGGALISGKYVLTAGHCVAGQVLDIGTPRRVRLGEYDISHEGQDCAPVEAGGEDCTDGVTRINIEKIIPHPQYNPVSPLKRNDIALLRLSEMAPFTDFIRPICLPTKDFTIPKNTPTNFTLYAAGWGAVSTRQSYSNVKLHVELPFVEQNRCQPSYSLPGRTVRLWEGQMCAGGVSGKDSCKGDSGGPLMYEDGRRYEVIGVVSFGPVPCGMEGIPGVYSKVYYYNDWIKSTIVP